MTRPNLPNEIILMIAQYLSPRGIANLMQGNRRLYTLLQGGPIYDRTPGSSRNGIILWASQHGREDVARAMLQRQGEFDSRDWNGFELISTEPTSELSLPLRFAAWYGHVGIIKLLLDWNIMTIKYDLQALPFAVSGRCLEAVKVLLEYSAKVSVYLSEAETETEEEIVISEEETSASTIPSEPDKSPSNVQPLIDRRHARYLDHALQRAIILGDEEMIDVFLRDRRARVSLVEAARIGSERFVKLCSLQEKPNVRKPCHVSPLSVAAKAGHVNILQILFQAGWNADLRDGDGKSPLSVAAANGQEAVVKMLLEREDIDADTADANGYTPLVEASRNGHTGIIELLLSTSNVNVNSMDSLGRSSFSYVAEKGNEDAVQLLLSAGADPDTCDHLGRSPLSLAAQGGFPGIVRLLLTIDGVDPNAKCESNRTPLAYAVLSGKFPGRVNGEKINSNYEEDEREMLSILQGPFESRLSALTVQPETEENGAALSIMKDLLADHRVDPNSRDSKGRSVLCLAILRAEFAAVRLLLSSKKIDVKSPVYKKFTPIELVKEKYRIKRLGAKGMHPKASSNWPS
ncbi:uncharacterized protein N7469_011578 [Penicillium citrinum]|uniref:F-box domain-containing protein n=1 Tax=Penicillium citrinum TaxID=5077 RepID=A0A9W9ND85_PENCI|nr:uncharacterized protein N7469_011578 [Penicillium citrinum]KAJ5216713.1 hypothetical protein N7469_011578 [Penicillium citrinum]